MTTAPCCKSCGVAFHDHLGVEGTCRKLQEAIADLESLRGAAIADEQRLLAAATRAGVGWFGCDAADHLADRVVELRQQVERLRTWIRNVREREFENAMGQRRLLAGFAWSADDEFEANERREYDAETKRIVEGG